MNQRLAWLTDIHFDFCDDATQEALLEEVLAGSPDGVLLGGDIANAATLVKALHRFDRVMNQAGVPVYLVLGNHDYYRSSVAEMNAVVRDYCRASRALHWLPDVGVVELTPNTALVGHGGWGDGRCGDYWGTPILLNDFIYIEELVTPSKQVRLEALQRLGDASAASLQRHVDAALACRPNVLVLMHVPPFVASCWHEGKVSDDQWSPFFVCKAAGDVLHAAMQAHPNHQMRALCGHTHSPGVAHILDNLRVDTGGAVYRKPEIAGWIEVA